LSSKDKTKLDFRPGPGTYQVDPDMKRPQESRTMGVIPNDKPMLRSYSAPSIPQNHQSYGYEEVGGGRLVRQGPKDISLWCTGRPNDCAGPGQYEPCDEVIKPRQCNGAFMKGPARVPLAASARETPGPGHYVAKSSLEVTSKSYLGGASFVSGSERGPSKRQETKIADGPGPGTYPQDSSKRPDLRELRSELQYFGSTVERFKSAPGKSSVPDHIGPGEYTRLLRKPEPPNARGFCSTMDRFKIDDLKPDLGPGPGTYERLGITDDSMGGPLATYSMLGNSGGLAFGSMNKRFVYAFEKEDRPGPGYYKVPGMSDDAEADMTPIEDNSTKSASKARRIKSVRLPGAAFASRTPKDQSTKSLVKEGLQKPPPGAYDPVLVKDQATVVRLRSKSEGFLSGGARFQGGQFAAPTGYHVNVGPGSYAPQAITGGKRTGTFNRSICEGMPESGRPKGLGFEAQDRRFRHSSHETKGPGPGSYNTDPKWISKSHNCYFGDLI